MTHSQRGSQQSTESPRSNMVHCRLNNEIGAMTTSATSGHPSVAGMREVKALGKARPTGYFFD